MQHEVKCITGCIIQKKAANIRTKCNEQLDPYDQIMCKFSEGWLHRFRIRWGHQSYKIYGKSGNGDIAVIFADLQKRRAMMKEYYLTEVIDCDESGLLFQLELDRTIAPSMFRGRKVQKTRFTLLSFYNATGIEKLPLITIGTPAKPHFFKNLAMKLGFYH